MSLDLTEYQLGKLRHALGLDYSNKPYRNYYHCNQNNIEWDDMCKKGYGLKKVYGDREIVYSVTLKGLRTVFRKNATRRYFEAINA